MTRLDKTALGAITLLALALLAAVWLGNPYGLRVSLLHGDNIGPWGPLTLEFSRPVLGPAFENTFSLNPAAPLSIELETPTRLRLRPVQVLVPEVEYTLRLNSGVYGVNGESLKSEQTWIIHLRLPQVIYVGADPQSREIFRVALDGSPPAAITHTGGRVLGFNAAPDGEQIAYAVANEQKGADLWLVDRDGGSDRRLHNCGPARCTTPIWSPDGSKIAFTQEAAGLSPGSSPGAPRPWVLNLADMQAAPVYADSQVIGYGPSWSPDGNRLAFWDGIQGGIRVLDLRTGQETLLPTESGEVGGWSPDGAQMLFTRYEPMGDSFYAFIYRADFTTGEVGTFIEGGSRDAAYGTPAWSADGRSIAISMRSNDESPERAIWIVHPDYLGGPNIGGEPGMTYGFYRWDPWGTALVLQRSRLGSQYSTEIAIYRLATGELKVLAEGGSLPQWLP